MKFRNGNTQMNDLMIIKVQIYVEIDPSLNEEVKSIASRVQKELSSVLKTDLIDSRGNDIKLPYGAKSILTQEEAFERLRTMK